MINILHSELQSNVGGIESFLLNLTESMDMTNIHFDILMRGNNQYLEEKFKALGVTIYKVPNNFFKYYSFVKNLLKNNNYDYVHVHKNSAANILLPIMVKRYSDAKLIVHSHNTNPSNGSKLGIILHQINKRKLIKLSDYRLACSDMAAEWMYGNDYKTKNVVIIKNGIIAKNYIYNSQIRKKMRKQLNLNDKFVIGHVGAFREQKNHKFLIDLFSKLNIKNKELVLVGKGPLEHKVKDQVKKLNIQNRVIFLGSRGDVPELLQSFDLFLMPSLWEGLSIAAVEAQASGLYTLVSENFSKDSKITDLLKFLPLSDEDAWIRAVNKYYFKRNKRKNMYLEINKSGYDMINSARIIEKIYKGKIDEK